MAVLKPVIDWRLALLLHTHTHTHTNKSMQIWDEMNTYRMGQL